MQRRFQENLPSTYDPTPSRTSNPNTTGLFLPNEPQNNSQTSLSRTNTLNIGTSISIPEDLSSLFHIEISSPSVSETSDDEINRENRGEFIELPRGIPWQMPVLKQRANSKYICKAYCKAMAQFMVKPIAEPYLRAILEDMQMSIETFRDFIKMNVKHLKGLEGLVFMLTFREGDTEQCKNYKRVLRVGCEVFLKYFAVNWIFHSKMADSRKYLEFRFKILHKLRMSLLDNSQEL